MDFAVDTEAYENEVEYASEWAQANTWLLDAVFRSFLDTTKWPQLGPLQRRMLRSGERREVLDTARQIPRSLGSVGPDEVGNQQVMRLSVRGLSYCTDAAGLLQDFLGCVRLLYRNYLAADEDPRITSSEVADELGFGPERLRAVSDVFLREGWILSGGSGTAADEWDQRIHDNARFLGSVESIGDYLRVQAEVLYLRTDPAMRRAVEAMARLKEDVVEGELRSRPPSAPRADWLHPVVRDAANALFAGGHYDEAVRTAAVALSDYVRNQAGTPSDAGLSGTSLMGRAFGGENPPIRIQSDDPQTQRNLQQGTMMIAQGLMQGVRNPLAHRRVDLTPDEALEMLAAMSLVARRVDEADSGPAEAG